MENIRSQYAERSYTDRKRPLTPPHEDSYIAKRRDIDLREHRRDVNGAWARDNYRRETDIRDAPTSRMYYYNNNNYNNRRIIEIPERFERGRDRDRDRERDRERERERIIPVDPRDRWQPRQSNNINERELMIRNDREFGRERGRGRGGRIGVSRPPPPRDTTYDYIIPKSNRYYEHDDREDSTRRFPFHGRRGFRRSDDREWGHDKFLNEESVDKNSTIEQGGDTTQTEPDIHNDESSSPTALDRKRDIYENVTEDENLNEVPEEASSETTATNK